MNRRSKLRLMSTQAKSITETGDGLLDNALMNTLEKDLSPDKQPKFNYKGIVYY